MKLCFIIAYLFLINTATAQPKTGKLLWQFATDGKIISTPCIYEDNIYFGSTDGNFYCIGLNNGKLIWKYHTGKAIRSSAAYGEGKIFVGCDDANIYAFDAKKGTLQWKLATKGEREYDLWDYYRSSPVYSKGKVFAGSSDGSVYCINVATGKSLWRYATGDMIHADPVINNDSLFIGSFNGNFYAFNSTTGKLIWKFKTVGDRYFPKGEIQKAALVTADAVYFGSRDYNLYALNRSTGAGLWNMKEYGSWIIATPAEKNGKLYFGTSDSHVFYCLNNFYGEILWKAPLPMRSYATPVFSDTLVIASCYNGFLYGFGQNSGELKWLFQTDASKKNYNSVYDSSGHFRTDFRMYGDDAATKAAEQKIMNLGAVISSPVVKDGIIYFGSTDGKLYAVKIE